MSPERNFFSIGYLDIFWLLGKIKNVVFFFRYYILLIFVFYYDSCIKKIKKIHKNPRPAYNGSHRRLIVLLIGKYDSDQWRVRLSDELDVFTCGVSNYRETKNK